MCVLTCMHVCIHVEANLKCCTSGADTFSQTESLTGLGHTNSTGQAGQNATEICLSVSPPQCQSYISERVWGIKIKSLCLHGQHFTETPLPIP